MIRFSLIVLSLLVQVGVAQEGPSKGALTERAWREFSSHQYVAAERDFRELIRIDSSNLFAHAYLGHALFRQEKYTEAVAPYEKAHELERSGNKLSQTDHRILVDQLVMAYGLDGQLDKAHKLLDEAIKQDPEYPMNYYNRACAFAEEGDKGKTLANLDLAFQKKSNVLKGEQMPDPRADASFQKYVRDSDFVNLMKTLALQ